MNKNKMDINDNASLLSCYHHLVHHHLINKPLNLVKYSIKAINQKALSKIGQCDINKCKCSLSGDIIDVLHYYLVHPYIDRIACKPLKSKSIMKPPNGITYSFGHRFYYWQYFKYNEEIEYGPNKGFKKKNWYIPKKYNSIKEEILTNTTSNLTIVEFDNTNKKAVLKHNVHQKWIKRSDTLGRHYDIKPGTQISQKHVFAVLLYTNYTELSAEFSRTFRIISAKETLKSLKQRNREFWWWSKLLTEAVQLHGSSVQESQIKVFFHGINTEMLFTSFVSYFCCPTSCSLHLEVALMFAHHDDGKGMVIQLSRDNDCSNLRYFNCVQWSDFPGESEMLFFGSERPLKITSVTEISSGQVYDKFIKTFTILDYMIKGLLLPDSVRETLGDAEFIKSCIDWNLDGQKDRNKCPKYVNRVFRAFCSEKTRISINLEMIRTVYPNVSKIFFDKGCDNLLNLDYISRIFPLMTIINIHGVGNISDLFVVKLIIKCQILSKIKGVHLNEINLYDVKYKQKILDKSFEMKFAEKFMCQSCWAITVDVKLDNDGDKREQIAESSVLSIVSVL